MGKAILGIIVGAAVFTAPDVFHVTGFAATLIEGLGVFLLVVSALVFISADR